MVSEKYSVYEEVQFQVRYCTKLRLFVCSVRIAFYNLLNKHTWKDCYSTGAVSLKITEDVSLHCFVPHEANEKDIIAPDSKESDFKLRMLNKDC